MVTLDTGFGEMFRNVGTTNEIVVIVKCHGPAAIARYTVKKVYAHFLCIRAHYPCEASGKERAWYNAIL